MPPRLSLAEQLAQLDSAVPTEFDPEHVENGLDDEEADLTAGRGHYIDVGPSNLRKAHDSILDPKYGGIRTSRKALVDEEDEEDDDNFDAEHDGDMEDVANVGDNAETEPFSDEDEDEQRAGEENSKSSEASDDDEFQDVSHDSKFNDARRDDLQSTLKRNREDDRRKGFAVTQQVETWDSLLDVRIRLQKSINAANRLPASVDVSSQTPEATSSLEKMLQEGLSLSEEIFDLQETMLFSSCELPPRKRRRLQDEDTIQDYEAYFEHATRHASAIEQRYHPQMVQTLTKWSAKIQAVAPSVLLPSNRNTFSKGSQNLKSVVQLIDEGLYDREKLLQRTQVWRGKGTRLGDRSEEHDAEIFDDTDFYQQLLRDIIDTKSGSSGPDSWVTAQKQRKAKKKVDTKASKGRKVRYDVHEKLQHFMVPIGVQGAWHEQQVDELFASLLGLGMESTKVPGEEIQPADIAVKEALQGGFRVFG